MGLGNSKEKIVYQGCEGEDPHLVQARYETVREMRNDLNNLINSIPDDGKRVAFTLVINKGKSEQTHVISGISNKQELASKLIKEAESEEEMIEGFEMTKNTNIILLILLIVAFIYRKELMAMFNK